MLEPQCAVPVEPDALDPRSYTLSLLGVCRENGLLDDTQCGRIRLGLDRIFAETAAEYTKRASSTIPRITARQLYDAVLFRCDAYLSRLPLLEGIHLLQQGNMEEICHRGMECILDAFTRCKEIFRQAYAIRCRPSVPISMPWSMLLIVFARDIPPGLIHETTAWVSITPSLGGRRMHCWRRGCGSWILIIPACCWKISCAGWFLLLRWRHCLQDMPGAITVSRRICTSAQQNCWSINC